MYKKFDLTRGTGFELLSHYTDIAEMADGVKPNDYSKFVRGRNGTKSKIVECDASENEMLMLIALPQPCKQAIMRGAQEIDRILVVNTLMYTFILVRFEDEDGFVAFNQSQSMYSKEFHCFTWDGRYRVYASEEEIYQELLGKECTPD